MFLFVMFLYVLIFALAFTVWKEVKKELNIGITSIKLRIAYGMIVARLILGVIWFITLEFEIPYVSYIPKSLHTYFFGSSDFLLWSLLESLYYSYVISFFPGVYIMCASDSENVRKAKEDSYKKLAEEVWNKHKYDFVNCVHGFLPYSEYEGKKFVTSITVLSNNYQGNVDIGFKYTLNMPTRMCNQFRNLPEGRVITIYGIIQKITYEERRDEADKHYTGTVDGVTVNLTLKGDYSLHDVTEWSASIVYFEPNYFGE